MERHIVLIGMMGSGKTTVGRVLSRITGLPFVDADQKIVEREGMSISDIFEKKGEGYFRKIESSIIEELLKGSGSIIATGGGIVLSEKNRNLIRENAICVFLYASVDILSKRLSGAKDRPLLKGKDLKDRLYTIWRERKTLYEECKNRIDTEGHTPFEIALSIITQFLPPESPFYIDKNIIWGRGITKRLSEFLKNGYKEPILIVTSSSLWSLWGKYVEDALDGFKMDIFLLPDGEDAKSMEYVEKLWEKMLSLNFSRKNPVILLGGGTVGDTGGFAASTFMRGVPLFQLPTTLLSQVDSSIGGKRGVNYRHLKNMIGTFYDATLTLFDPIFLATLPLNEIRNGLSEAIKSAIIGDARLFEFIDAHIDDILSYNISALGSVVKKSAELKIRVVKEDPYERKGKRKVLNLGHTLGHALEGIDGFSISHGEAVAIGMVFASFLGERMGVTSRSVRCRIERLIKKAGLPVAFPKKYRDVILDKMLYDKKREDENLFWVIPEDIGKVGFYKLSRKEAENYLDLFIKEVL